MKKVKKRTPKPVKRFPKKLQDFWYCYSRMMIYFENDEASTLKWFSEKNTFAHGMTPMKAIELGRTKQLRLFVGSLVED